MQQINDQNTKTFLADLERQHSGAPRVDRRMNFFQRREGFDAGTRDRLTEDWRGVESGPNSLNRTDGKLMRARARSLVMNNPLAKSGVDAYISNVLASGIMPKPQGDEGQRNAWLDAWNNWSLREADITGHQHLYELAALWLEEVIVGGGCLVHFRQRPPALRRSVNLSIELIPEEQIADDNDMFVVTNNRKKGKNPIIGGCEIDPATGKPVAWYVRRTHPDDLLTHMEEPQRIPASQVHYGFFKKRIGQYRGYTLLHAVVQFLWKQGYYLDNELMNSAIRSCWSAMITTEAGDGEWGDLSDGDPDGSAVDAFGNSLEKMQPGMIWRGLPGDDIKAVGPNTPSGDASPWLMMIQRSISAGMNQSYEEVMRDYSQGNFSSTRAASNADRRRYKSMQKFCIYHFLQPVWERFAKNAARSGLPGLPSPAEFVSTADEHLNPKWRVPGWDSVNPWDDARAAALEIESGLNSEDNYMGERGRDLDEVYEELAEAKRRREELDITTKADVAEQAAQNPEPANMGEKE